MEINEVEQTSDVPQNEEQADELLASIEPQEQAGIKESAPVTQTQAPQETWDGKSWSFKVGGKEVVPQNREQVLKWAEMGHSAPQKIGELAKQIQEYKTREAYINESHKKYSEIDDYIKSNPQFWNHVMQAWQNRNQALQDTSNPLAQTVQGLQQQMQELIQYKQTIENQQKQYKEQAEDQAYMTQLDEMKKSYPKVDFITPGEDGKSLEYKVLEHAVNNGIKNFKTAFRDFYHDELVKMAAEETKEKLAKDKQKNAKLGIIGKSPTPTKGITSSDVKGKSYADLAAEALQELRTS